jgi:hypothetical protein
MSENDVKGKHSYWKHDTYWFSWFSSWIVFTQTKIKMWDFRFPQRWVSNLFGSLGWGTVLFGRWVPVFWRNILPPHSVWMTFLAWKLRQHIPLERWLLLTKIHSITFLKTSLNRVTFSGVGELQRLANITAEINIL